MTEVLQGLKRDVKRIEAYLSLFDLLEASGFETYRNAAVLFRLARSKGVSLTTTDALIATIAAENGAEIFSLDRDFVSGYLAKQFLTGDDESKVYEVKVVPPRDLPARCRERRRGPGPSPF